MHYTDEQRRAIHQQNTSVVLSAGAGCGKTFVLTERFLRQLDPTGRGPEPDALSRLVAITFTQRAAREMRDRIRRHCQQRAREATDPRVQARWQQLLHQLHTARISTIDSFCAALLRRWAVEAELDPEFRVLDEFQARVLQHQATREVLRQWLDRQDPVLMFVARRLELSRLSELLEQIVSKAPYIDFAAWLPLGEADGELPGPVAPGFPHHLTEAALRLYRRWEGAFYDWAERLRAELLEDFDVQELHRRMSNDQISGKTGQSNRQVWLAELPRLWQAPVPEMLEALREIRQAWRFQGRWQNDGELAEKIKQFKETLEPLLKTRDWNPQLLWDEAQFTAAVLYLVRQVFDHYQQEKRRQGALDFADLLARAIQVLGRDEVRRQESRQIELLLVDEFQDTNPLQVQLIQRLLDGRLETGRLFLVGDYKQSIYRFRHAEPKQFLEMRNRIPTEGRLPLSRNFRSRPQVLDFVNTLFDGAFEQEYEPLHPHKQRVEPECTVEFLWALPEPDEEKRSVAEARMHEADLIARRIVQLLGEREPLVYEAQGDQVHSRPVEPGDVAILFRAMSDLPYYESALQRYDIPYYVVRGTAFFAQQEIYDLAHLLRAVLWPEDEVALLGVLRSPLFGIRDDVLLAMGPPLSRNFYQECWPQSLPEDQRQGLQHARETLTWLQQAKDRLSVSQLILEALRRTGYEATLLAEFLGQRKLANLHKLLDMARAADASGAMTLADFVYQLESLVAQEPDEPSAALHPEAHGSVKLMSIHQSKGLEFPVVIVADCNRRKRVSARPFFYHPQYGPVVKLSAGRPRNAQSLADALSHWEQQEEEQEALRLFYVATTRAADYLILSAGFEDSQMAPANPWMTLLQERFDVATGQCRRPGREALPQVRVAEQVPQPKKRRAAKRPSDPEELFSQARQRNDKAPKKLQRFWSPVPPDAQAVAELSISRLEEDVAELLGWEQEHAPGDEAPSGEGGARAIQVGQLVHEVLARWDFAQETAAELPDRLNRAAGLLGLVDSAPLDEAEQILRTFLESPLVESLQQARLLRRELEFLLAWPLEGEPQLRFRGFIDCLFQDAQGRWHLVDYKTSTGEKIDLEELAQRYKPQLWLYAQAVAGVLGQEPDTAQVWFLRHGRSIPLQWQAEESQELIRAIDQAIDRLRQRVVEMG